jgi:hypothetical protein
MMLEAQPESSTAIAAAARLRPTIPVTRTGDPTQNCIFRSRDSRDGGAIHFIAAAAQNTNAAARLLNAPIPAEV